MHGLVIGSESEFADELVTLVRSDDIHSCRWHSDWPTIGQIDCRQFNLVVCHIHDESAFDHVIQWLRKIGKSDFPVPVIAIGQNIELENKIRLLKAGVFEYLDRPINRQRLRFLIDAIAVKAQIGQRRSTVSDLNNSFCKKLGSQVRKIADIDANVLITGETGVGKTYIAKQIHGLSKRRAYPFVAINCGAIPENLIESELFGHAKGTFTGADKHRIGKFAYAKNGTILLDEIDALPLSAQSKLLHVVDEHVYQPLGTNESRPVTARILAATNKSLDELVKQGEFRSDLFFRLDVIELEVAPLRDRRNEILVFASLFAEELSRKYGRNPPSLTTAVKAWMTSFDWPGNLRELRNCVEHAFLSCQNGTIEMEHLPLRVRRNSNRQVTNGRNKNSVENGKSHAAERNDSLAKQRREIQRVIRALEHNDFNRTRAAREMGISRTAFYKKLHSLGLI